MCIHTVCTHSLVCVSNTNVCAHTRVLWSPKLAQVFSEACVCADVLLQAGYSEQPSSSASGVKDLLVMEPKSKRCVVCVHHVTEASGDMVGT